MEILAEGEIVIAGYGLEPWLVQETEAQLAFGTSIAEVSNGEEAINFGPEIHTPKQGLKRIEMTM